MTNREAKIEQAKCDVRRQESLVREARNNLNYGHAKAKADFDREYERLKSELERSVINLECETTRLRALEDNAIDGQGDLV
jgi:F0F1-type ATP synthase membrane subunit b/b'